MVTNTDIRWMPSSLRASEEGVEFHNRGIFQLGSAYSVRRLCSDEKEKLTVVVVVVVVVVAVVVVVVVVVVAAVV